jgi:hypothetical protein
MGNKIIFFGASYSLIFAIKYAQSGTKLDIVCSKSEKEKINKLKIEYSLNDKVSLRTIEIKNLKKVHELYIDSLYIVIGELQANLQIQLDTIHNNSSKIPDEIFSE